MTRSNSTARGMASAPEKMATHLQLCRKFIGQQAVLASKTDRHRRHHLLRLVSPEANA
jgi:adenylosuccinate lyase